MNENLLAAERQYCGKACRMWMESTIKDISAASGYEVVRVMAKYVKPNIYEVMFQLYEPKSKYSSLHNWFGTACCGICAEAKAFSDYYDNELA